MKTFLLVAALALPATALAETPAASRDGDNFRARLYERYCDKLRDSPQAYVLFVRRLQPVYGYTFTDFAPENRGDPVVADCKVAPERVAAVNRELRKDAR